MRICLITTFFPPLHFGGDGVFVANFANALANAGHQIHVIHCADSFWLTRGNVEPSPVLLHPGITVHTLSSALGALSPILTQISGSPWLKRKKIAEILELGFDVIHWHNISLIGGPGALDLGTGVKLCSLHDYWFTCPTHILFKDKEQACVQRNCLRCQLVYRRLPQLWRNTQWMAKGMSHIDRFLVPSLFVQEQFRKAPQSLDTTVLPHFVPGLKPAAPDKCSDSGYYFYCGRLEKAKGLQTILPLFCRTGRRLLVAGSGSYETELRRLAERGTNIEFLGRISYDKLNSLYRGARATLIPSICYETFGLVALESLREQTPIITSGFGALLELVSETGGGVVYQSNSQLESLLDQFDRYPEMAAELGRIGHSNIGKFSEAEHIRRFFQIVNSVR